MRGLVFVLVMVVRLGGAAAAPRYGDPVAVGGRDALSAAVEEHAQRIAAEVAARRTGAGGSAAERLVPYAPLARDARLEAAMDLLQAHSPSRGAPPVALREQALWLSGIVEPMPYLITIHVPEGAGADVLEQLSRLLPPVLERGHYRRVAASVAGATADSSSSGAGGARELLLALQESYVDLAPVPRVLPAGGKTVVTGTLLAPYERPALFITGPDGAVQRVDVGSGAERFRAAFRCGANGVYQIEVAGEDRWGDAVLANFPVYCGVAAPTSLVLPAGEREGPWQGAAAVEARLVDLLQADRRRVGLPRLAVDAQLAAVARGHSEEMRDGNFFGHVSPTTGTAADRLRRAGIQPLRVLENLARGGSTVDIERGLMGSPSHRANLLSPDVERVGIGVALGPVPAGGGERDLYVTQLFAHLASPLDPGSADRDLRQRLDVLRRSAHRPLLRPDPALDALARQIAENVARGPANGAGDKGDVSGPVERALPQLSERYRWVKTVVAEAAELEQLGSSPALLDAAATHAGVAAVPAAAGAKAGAPSPGGGVVLVVLLAAGR